MIKTLKTRPGKSGLAPMKYLAGILIFVEFNYSFQYNFLVGRTVNHTRNEVDGNKPHHARAQSTPFSYGDITKSSFMPVRHVSLEEKTPYIEKARSVSPPVSDPGLSWLEKQQLKLKDRRDGRGTLDRRYKESRMLAELQENHQNVQNQINSKIIEESVCVWCYFD